MTVLEAILLTVLVVLYFAMLIFLGMTTIRNGRMLFFVLGIFMPLFWIFGAIMPPAPTAADAVAEQTERDHLHSY